MLCVWHKPTFPLENWKLRTASQPCPHLTPWKGAGWLEVEAGGGAGGAQTAVGSGYWAVAVGCLPSTRLSLWFLCTFRTLTVGAAVSSLTAPNENASGGFSSQLPNQSQFISEHPPDRGSGGSPCARPAQLPL